MNLAHTNRQHLSFWGFIDTIGAAPHLLPVSSYNRLLEAAGEEPATIRNDEAIFYLNPDFTGNTQDEMFLYIRTDCNGCTDERENLTFH